MFNVEDSVNVNGIEVVYEECFFLVCYDFRYEFVFDQKGRYFMEEEDYEVQIEKLVNSDVSVFGVVEV